MFILVGGSNFLLQRYGVLELSASHEGPESWETLGLGGFLSHGGTPNHPRYPRYPRVGIQIVLDFTKFHQPKTGFDATAALHHQTWTLIIEAGGISPQDLVWISQCFLG